MKLTPEFIAAGTEFVVLLGDPEAAEPVIEAAMTAAARLAPPSLRGRIFEEIVARLGAAGFLPAPRGFSPDGSPIFAVADVAEKHGVSSDAVREILAPIFLGGDDEWLTSDAPGAAALQ